MAFIKNRWYVAAWANELTQGAVGRRILGEYLVLYRGASGSVTVMTGRCPHRFAPLDQGRVVGDSITCPYHGLQFSSDGKCQLNPHGDGYIPIAAQLKAYPVAERNGAIWVWLGNPELADPLLLPSDNFWNSPDYASQFIHIVVEAHYELVTDNLLDLTHAPFLHANTLAGNGGERPPLPRHEFKVDGEVVHSNYYFDRSPTSAVMKTLFSDPVGRFEARMTWRPACTLELDIWQHALPDGTAETLHLPSMHYLTPETEGITHYFACQARNRKIEDPAEDELMRSWVVKAFTEEDAPMLRACQSLMGTNDLLSLKPAILKTDAAAIQARRIVSRLLTEEAGTGEPCKALPLSRSSTDALASEGAG